MSEITLRSGKGSRLTSAEVDANFNNLNNDKQEKITIPIIVVSTVTLTVNAYHKILQATTVNMPAYSQGSRVGLINMSTGNVTLAQNNSEKIMGINDSITIDIKNIPIWFRASDTTHGWILE